MAHDEFEIAIERRLQGALEPGEGEALELHLATCASCLAYEAEARALNYRLKTMVHDTVSTIDMVAVGARAQQMLRAELRQRWLGPLLFAVITTLTVVGAATVNHHRVPLALMLVQVAAVSLVSFVFLSATTQRHRQHEAQLARQGALAFYRERLDKQIRIVRWVRGLSPPLALFYVILTVSQRTGPTFVPCLFTTLCLGFAFVFSQFVRLPRLLREREQLR